MARNYLKTKFEEFERTNEWMKLYQKLKVDSDKQEQAYNLSVKVSRHPDNANKNRYRDVSAYDHCRVTLKNRGENDSYINATPITVEGAGRKYILSQGPLASTANDFWEMIWQEKSRAIVMLNRIIEKNAIKCHQYYPEESFSRELQLESFVINLISERVTPHFVVRELELRRLKASEDHRRNSCGTDSTGSRSSLSPDEEEDFKSDEVRLVSHYQFTTWPDFGVPQSAEDFLEFLYEVRKSGQLNWQAYGPPVIHCSAGIGRSGTFVIVDAILVMVENGSDPQSVNLCELVLELRKSRMGLIQTMEQLRFSWKAVVDAISEEKWRPLMKATSCDRSESPTSNTRRLDRGVANQLISGGHFVSVDESELRKRSIVDISESLHTSKSARVGVSDPMCATRSKRRSTSIAGDECSPPLKKRDEHESDDDGEPQPAEETNAAANSVSKSEARRIKVNDMVTRMRQSEQRLQRDPHLFGLRIPSVAAWGAGAAVVVAVGFFCYYNY
uniref:protein-tyrosine-phosphatase n=1 Tax=Plectus sambesii TaxID=2011161 RepID=A0A914VUY4_9BILA